MIPSTPELDNQLRKRLADLTSSENDYWSFKGNSRREHGHSFFQYPAMMVPQVARAVLEQARIVHPEISSAGDPFLGSGTILTESMLKGLNFSGSDINPLAVLLCRVKAGPFFVKPLREKVAEVLARIEEDRSWKIEVDFTNRDKWFQKEAQIALSKIRRSILKEESNWARKFFWIGLAEAVRYTSNSRTSTFKLHIRTDTQINSRILNPIGLFKKAILRNVESLEEKAERLNCEGYMKQGRYQKEVKISLGDSRKIEHSDFSDIIITSPPYGDNTTTVPYGQYSYLPLQWIELSDIDPSANSDYLKTTQEIDRISLGGNGKILEKDRVALSEKSPAFQKCIAKLKDQPIDRKRRVTAFFRDLDNCLDPILNRLNPGGLMVWILGNRKVGGNRVEMDQILSELLYSHNALMISKLSRNIFSKRMASKNNVAETMTNETILVMRKTK